MGPLREHYLATAVGNFTSIAMEDQGDLANSVRNTTFKYG